MKKILIVDDEFRIREVIKEYGNLYNYEVMQASDGMQAIQLASCNHFDCIILDIMMPNLDGYSACKKLKEICDAPIIMLSARVEEKDKLYGFELGIDDYVSKPFSPKELMARVKVVIERNNKTSDKLDYKDLSVDIESHLVTINHQEIHLTNKEFDLLVYLLTNSNKAISRETLIEKIWGYDSVSFDRTVDTHIKMLRKNLKEYGKNIITIRGVGYKFEKN